MSDLARRLTLRHLRLMVMLAELGSITRTAQLMHITQPAVSKAVRDMREMLGDPLFEATPDGLAWTAPGKAALQRARAILRNLEDLARDTERARLGKHERFAVGTTRVAEAAVAAAVPAGLLQAGLTLSLHRGTRERMHGELARKTIDIAFGRCDAGFRLADFEYHPIYGDRFTAICGKAHPLARRRSVGLDELAEQQWILPPQGTFAHHVFEQAFLSENREPPQGVVLSTLGLADVRMVETHPLLALFPESEALRLQRAGTVRCVDGLALPPQQIGAILLRAQPRHPAAELAMRIMRDYTAELRAQAGGRRPRGRRPA